MPSANKTPNYRLNQWQGNEYPKRIDFVEDNQKIDNELKKNEDHRNDTAAHVTQAEHNAIASAVQGATFGGEAVPKNDGVLDFPMPTAEQMIAASKGTCITDFNSGDALISGIYGFNVQALNAPFTGYGIVIVRVYNSGDPMWRWIWQEVYSASDLSQHLIRSKINNGGWSNWIKPDANMADYASGNIALTTPGLRNITMSTAEPSGGQDGDMWIQYS